MIRISPQRILAKRNRVIALFIHYILKTVFLLYRLTTLKTSQTQESIPINRIKKILIIRIDGLGDVVKSTPAFKAIRGAFRDSHITMLAASWSKGMVEVMPTFDEVIYFDAPWVVKDKKGKFKEIVEILRKLRSEKFDLAIDLRGDFRNNILMFLCGVKYCVGYDITGCGFLLTHAVSYNSECSKYNEIEHTMQLLKILNLYNIDSNQQIWITQEDEKFADTILNGERLSIAIHPANAKIPLKQWSVERFAEISNRLINKYKAELIFLGSLSELKYTRDISKLIQDKHYLKILVGKTTLREAAAIIANCSLFIGIDSGLMHIADALGIPIVALFGPGNLTLFRPCNSRHIVIKKEFECSPCSMRRCKKSDYNCMKAISVEEVWDAIAMQINYS